MTENETPAALPVAGGSTQSRFDPRTPDLSGQNLSLEEAASTFQVSERTLRRQLSAGLIAGAVRQGRRWLIPRASLLGLYELKEPAFETPPVQTLEPHVLELIGQLLEREGRAQSQLEAKTGQLEALNERLLGAEIRAAKLEAELEALKTIEAETRAKAEEQTRRLEEGAEALALELEALKSRRRQWLRRKPKA
jgi:hypothetical protein